MIYTGVLHKLKEIKDCAAMALAADLTFVLTAKKHEEIEARRKGGNGSSHKLVFTPEQVSSWRRQNRSDSLDRKAHRQKNKDNCRNHYNRN
jgi:hypothetical protein